MKKYRVNVVGTKYITTDTEDKAIEQTQDMLDHIHKSLNMQVFSIAEVIGEQWVKTVGRYKTLCVMY